VGDPVEGLPARRLARRGYVLEQRDDARSDDLSRDEMFAGQSEQKGRRVMFERPSLQELIQLRDLQRTRLTPAEIAGRRSEVIGAGLVPLPVSVKLTHRDL
jgi:hypothetical protein